MDVPDLAGSAAAQREYELLKVLAEHYFGSMMVTDEKGRFLYVNDGCCKLLGIDRETLLRISIYDTLHDYCHASSASSIKTLETRRECLSNHTLEASGKQVLALSRPHFGPDGQLQFVPTYSWDERELYTLLEKFDQERNNVKHVIRFMQGTDKAPDMLIAESQPMRSLLEYAGPYRRRGLHSDHLWGIRQRQGDVRQVYPRQKRPGRPGVHPHQLCLSAALTAGSGDVRL